MGRKSKKEGMYRYIHTYIYFIIYNKCLDILYKNPEIP